MTNPTEADSGMCEIPMAAMDRLAEVESLRWRKFPLLSSGFVCLVDCMGDDAAIVQAARVSYGAGTKSVQDDAGLLRYLMRHRHTTPYEMAELKFLIRCPMDMWRQQIRHRTASVNEYSTRYSVAIDECDETPPDAWRLQSDSNKQGSTGRLGQWPEGWMEREEVPVSVIELMQNRLPENPTAGQYLSEREKELHQHAREVYRERVEDFGIAREQARKDLPLSTYTEAYWKIDLHNLLHFLGLRMDAHAQWEIRQYARTIGEEIVRPLFPATWDAFEKYRLNATFVSQPAKQVLQAMIESHPTHSPPYTRHVFYNGVMRTFPDWVETDKSGALKRHREREEVQQTLVSLGLLQAAG